MKGGRKNWRFSAINSLYFRNGAR